MSEPSFRIASASVAPHTAAPAVSLEIEARSSSPVASLLLHTSVRIEAGLRKHDDAERADLREMFGDESVWGRSAKTLSWAQLSTTVTAFEGKTRFELALPCSFDLAAVASKYLRAVRGGSVPIRCQFSGTVFSRGEHGLEARPIPSDAEASFALPVSVFEEAIALCFPDGGVLAVSNATYAKLERFRTSKGLASFDEAIEALLAADRGRSVA